MRQTAQDFVSNLTEQAKNAKDTFETMRDELTQKIYELMQ